jgi:hypothetical protein
MSKSSKSTASDTTKLEIKEEKSGKVEDNFDVTALITTMIADLMYNSFDVHRIRKGLYDLLTFREIIVLVSAYCQIGNNVGKATRKKVMKPHPEVAEYLRKSGAALSRIGAAFAALVYHIRKNFRDNLQQRVRNCVTPFEFQDPALAPYHESGRDFFAKFSVLIKSPQTTTDYYELARQNLDVSTREYIGKSYQELIDAIKNKTY